MRTDRIRTGKTLSVIANCANCKGRSFVRDLSGREVRCPWCNNDGTQFVFVLLPNARPPGEQRIRRKGRPGS